MHKRLMTAAPYLLIAGGVLSLVGYWWLTRPRISDAVRLERLVMQVARGVEQHDLGAIMGAVSQDYHDSAGYDRREIWRQAVRYVGSRHPTRVRISDFSADVSGNVAIATMEVAVTATDEVSFAGSLSAHFRREGFPLWSRWRITNTEGWQAAVQQYREQP